MKKWGREFFGPQWYKSGGGLVQKWGQVTCHETSQDQTIQLVCLCLLPHDPSLLTTANDPPTPPSTDSSCCFNIGDVCARTTKTHNQQTNTSLKLVMSMEVNQGRVLKGGGQKVAGQHSASLGKKPSHNHRNNLIFTKFHGSRRVGSKVAD